MTVDFKLDANDYLMHQLYTASKSDRIRKKRKRNRLIVPLVYIVLGLLLLYGDSLTPAVCFFIIAILWYLFYPKWDKRRYLKHYEAFIKENYKERFGRVATAVFNNDYIVLTDSGSESKVSTKEIQEIFEIPSSIFVKLKTGEGLILPKNKINNIDRLKDELKQLAAHLNINYSVDSNWQWK